MHVSAHRSLAAAPRPAVAARAAARAQVSTPARATAPAPAPERPLGSRVRNGILAGFFGFGSLVATVISKSAAYGGAAYRSVGLGAGAVSLAFLGLAALCAKGAQAR